MYKKTLMVIIMMILPLQLFAMNGTVYEHVCQRIEAWQNATGLEVRANEPNFYQISIIGDEDFHKNFRLPMKGKNIAEKCRNGLLKQLPYMPQKGMLEVIFKDELPLEVSRSTSIPVLFLEFVTQ